MARRLDAATKTLHAFLVSQQRPFVLLGVVDHGGYEKDHDEATCAAIRTVPLLQVVHGACEWSPPRFRKTTGLRTWLLNERKKHHTVISK